MGALVVKMPDEDPGDEFINLVVAVDQKKPKQSDVLALKEYFVTHPDYAATLGNLANMAQVGLIEKSTKSTKAITLSITAYCDQLRNELGYAGASMTERLLIETIVLAWLRYHYQEMNYSSAREDGLSHREAEYYEKRVTQCHKRYLRSIEALARVRRLLKEPRSPAFNLLLAQQFTSK